MNSSEPNTIGLDDEAWQRLLSGIADGNTPGDLSQLNPLGLDYSAEFDHLLEFSSSDDVPGKPNSRLLNFCTLSPPAFAGEFPAQVSQTIEAAPPTEPRTLDSEAQPIGENLSSIVERLHQE